MNIIAQYDSSVANAPSGFKTAVQAAISFFDRVILDPITVTLVFSYGSIQGKALSSGALGESSTNGYIEPYATVVSQLQASAKSAADATALASLPATDPTHGGMFWVSDSEAKVFGVSSDPNFTDPEDGFVALSSSFNFTYDPANRAVAGAYDAIGVIEHEISEALGRISYLGQATFQGQTLFTQLDLFRYASAGVPSLSTNSGYFSLDGTHLTLPFNSGSSGADTGDWTAAAQGDAYGEAFSGQALLVSPTDMLVMDAIGFHVADLPSKDFLQTGQSQFVIEKASGAVVVGSVSGGVTTYDQIGALGPEWSFRGYGDYYGDGHVGVLLQNTAGAVVIGEVLHGAMAYTLVQGLPAGANIVASGDFLRAGSAQFLTESPQGQVQIVEAGPDRTITSPVTSLGPEWSFHGAGDFIGDGASAFLIENTAGAVVIGEIGTDDHVTYTQVAALGPEWTFVGVGDFLGDGKADFLIENTKGVVVAGEVGANGKAVFTQVAALGPEWSFHGAGDYLGLGHDQFLIENTAGAVVAGDVEQGQAHFTQIAGLGSEWFFHP